MKRPNSCRNPLNWDEIELIWLLQTNQLEMTSVMLPMKESGPELIQGFD